LGYRILRTSVVTRDGLDALAAALTGQTSVIAGLSGVGKSALLTAVQPGLALRSEGVSQATGKGKHTTTAATLLQLKGGGYVVDTPGIREFLPAGLNPAELGHHWPEFRSLLTGCRFKNCLHNREVGCAVQDAAESEVIHPHRYDSYLRILESLLEE
ncbi:MAG: ribosome small subunit-dependent GTPase A, partial [Planctomycetes bacterium]|nr:ribosome small subunit-dependent GTPase A [Planctomycetota bacterium]